jgi:hypothetical protein
MGRIVSSKGSGSVDGLIEQDGAGASPTEPGPAKSGARTVDGQPSPRIQMRFFGAPGASTEHFHSPPVSFCRYAGRLRLLQADLE